MRMAFRVLAMVAGLLFCLPPHYFCRLLGRPSPWPRRFLTWVGRRAGLRPRVIGAPHPGKMLVVANHVSWLDIMLVAEATGAAFVSRDDVGRWPVIGWLARQNNTLFVARSNKREVHGQADALREALATGQPVALFPEGTTDGGMKVLPFRASLLAAAVPPPEGLKVQPVAIDYGESGQEIAWVGGESAGDNARRILSRPGRIPVTLTFLEPIDPARTPDRKRLAQAAREAIIASLDASATLPAGL